MRVIDPGHCYELDSLDGDGHVQRLRFVKRVGDKYPGNQPPAYPGPTSQEVLRALIDRTVYADGQIDHTTLVGPEGHVHNKRALDGLRQALRSFEQRAAEERGDRNAAARIMYMTRPELEPTCVGCGHILCTRTH